MNKYTDKIKKLLALSLSDNPHEAAAAMRQATALMNKHNITADQVNSQPMIVRDIEAPFAKIPRWFLNLYGAMTQLCGCHAAFSNGRHGHFGKLSIAGRERDVENSIYLVEFTRHQLEVAVDQFKKEHHARGLACEVLQIKSFRIGFVNRIFTRLHESRQQFFTAESQTGLVCIDDTTRLKTSRIFMEERALTQGRHLKEASDKTKRDAQAMLNGAKSAEEVALHNALNKHQATHQLEKLT